LTEPGRKKLAESSSSHMAAIEKLFADRYSPEEIETLAGLLGRLSGTDGVSCAPPD
jgi:hypothetical protein